MPKLRMFAVCLAPPFNDNPVYWGGQMVQGTVVVDLSEPMKMRGIHLKFQGGANVHWSERRTSGSGKNRHTRTVHYRSSEQYFNLSMILFGKPLGQMSGDNPVLDAGHYEYPFNFQLPLTLPSSFEGRHGRVRYYLEARIDKPWKIDHVTKRPFTVLNNLDLNTMPQLQMGSVLNDEKTICCLCCASGPIQMEVRLDRTGFVPGEFVFVTASVRNNSSRRICSAKILLYQVIHFHATRKTRSVHAVLAELVLEGLEPYASREYTNVMLQVPPAPASGLPGCNIISIDYVIKAIADPSGPALDLEVMIPVTIGTSPLADSYAYYLSKVAPPAYSTVEPTAPPPALPPPSYNELYDKSAITIEDSDSETEAPKGNMYGETNWAPRYTYYTYSAPEPSAPEMIRT